MGTKPLNIFKAGRHTAMSGQALAFTEDDLRATVAAYDPTLHEAPLVVGHPRHDLPAYGWVSSLQYGEDGLEAVPAQVDTAFAELVAAGKFKKISASFYAPDAPSNPVPGVYYLRHVGFLGAQPPAVKGLRSPSFGDTEEGVVTFSEWDAMTNAGLWRNLREWILGKFGAEEADKVLPGYDVRALELGAQEDINLARAATNGNGASLPGFADPAGHTVSTTTAQESTVTEEEAARLRADNEAKARRIAELEGNERATQVAAAHAANVAFADGLVGEGRLLPASHDMVVAALDHLAAPGAVVEFGEGDARQPLAGALRTMLQALPKQVEFGETATRDRVAGGQSATVAFAAPAGYGVDAVSMTVHQKALAHQKANPGCSYLDAVTAVS